MQKHLFMPRDTMWAATGAGKKRNAKWVCSSLWVSLNFHRNSSVTATRPLPFMRTPCKLRDNRGPFRHLQASQHSLQKWLGLSTEPPRPDLRRICLYAVLGGVICPGGETLGKHPPFSFQKLADPAAVKGPNLSVGKEFSEES